MTHDPNGPPTIRQRERLYRQAVQVHRKVPRHLTFAQAEAPLAEFERLPKHGPLEGDSIERKIERGRRERAKMGGG